MIKKRWVYRPARQPKPKVPDSTKQEVERKAGELIDSVLKPRYIEPPAEDEQFNYLAEISAKWYRSYFYFCSKYNSPGPSALAPSFEDRFARLEYVREDKFNLSYMRHTRKWVEIAQAMPLDQALAMIEAGGPFHP